MWLMAKQLGYEPLTTFWDDFTIAERFNVKAIEETARKAFNEWKDNYKYLTELIMVINHKCWEHYHNGNNKLSDFYSNLYYEYDERAIDYLEKNYGEEELRYFFRTLD